MVNVMGTSYFLNGNIKTNEKYTRGIVIQKKEYKADGVLVLTSYMINGSSKMQVYKYNSSGKLESEGFEDLNGLKVGEWIYYDENKNQIKIENYKSGERIKG
jgi:antitoxin component YwqK of YwqJK toxin-antitoxin module